jgi:hypothetical protein
MDRKTFLRAHLAAITAMVAVCAPATSQAQILNTRPLSQPYTNPSSPNAGEYGSRSAPSYRDLSAKKELDARRAVPPGPGQGSCWTDSIGNRHCR